ncbi:hypothetical protein CBER1_10047 [Cercospora berteroae]|uniref:Glycosyltransferase 2-like domain-containing protein n=1 Tax=Cercospora berteroae TaxID=357750 RepID=A0A2S6BX85_9PEZI|nr:hypothetical protein CBER1_10047 [Cercospora berteroae]
MNVSTKADMYHVQQTKETLPPISDQEKKQRKRADAIWRLLTLSIWSLQSYLIYLLIQGIRSTKSDDEQTWIPSLFICWQITQLVTSILGESYRFILWSGVNLRQKTRLVGDRGPLVDIIVVSCGEDRSVILDTLRSVCAQDYPSFRVLLGDDGNDDELQEDIRQLREVSPCELLYYRRPGKSGCKRGYKAGNMNAALAYLDTVGPRRTEFCAFLDCDMIVESDFLRATIGHLLPNRNAGVVVVPQSFYNLPPNDPLYSSMYIHNWQDQVERDTLGAVWETGPGVVFRRKAIEAMGGFDEWVLMEDIIAGMLLNGLGWETVLCYEQLQWGLVPDTFAGYIAQRRKWCVGTIRGAMIARLGFHPQKMSKLTWRQRTVQFWYCISPYVSVTQRTLLPLAFLLLVATKQPLIVPINLRLLRRMTVMIGIAYRVQFMVSGMLCSYHMVRRKMEAATWLSPYLFLVIVKELLPHWLAGVPMRFTPTQLLESNLLERDAKLRAPRWHRLVVTIVYQGLWYHLLVATIAVSMFYDGYVSARSQKTADGVCLYLWSHILAPGGDWLVYGDLLAPLFYMVWPPTMPSRRDMLQKSSCGKMETWYPKLYYRQENWEWYGTLVKEVVMGGAYAFYLLVDRKFCT